MKLKELTPKKVLLVGHYGSGNYGDDIMLQSLIDEYTKKGCAVKVIFFGDSSPGINFKNGKSLTINRKNKIEMLSSWIKATLSCDVIVWGGGTCFTDEEGDGHFIPMMISKLLGRPFIYRAVGIGNLNRPSRKLKTKILLKLCDSISFREEKSATHAKEISPSQQGKYLFERDLGEVYLSKIASHYKNKNKNNLVLAWRELEMYPGGNKINEICEYTYRIARNLSLDILILDTDNNVDRTINNTIENELKKKSDLKISRGSNLSFSEKNNILANAALVITARLHIGIAAREFGVPLKIYPYSPKIEYAFSEKTENIEKFNLK